MPEDLRETPQAVEGWTLPVGAPPEPPSFRNPIIATRRVEGRTLSPHHTWWGESVDGVPGPDVGHESAGGGSCRSLASRRQGVVLPGIAMVLRFSASKCIIHVTSSRLRALMLCLAVLSLALLPRASAQVFDPRRWLTSGLRLPVASNSPVLSDDEW
jgi:hypothetical protein